ncbi:hypothetical protein H310_14367 [Aphanomyces invadans]|uniref:Nuclear condensin complex subunit 3 C-terminal domain-containing protein n=1 Tax=Aphanomyces invadans TaxID=157072 RepID=A0A024TA98_9STRA|nr:hypothetical protein H310_14367 [Aphanomyces invadans]ETV90953.1 hypothetical protein H310_14367 [Aphanomyces invadans]|eukprot:XP_008880435.1 hypothetical protein H310_14367 [Aphanomyces invadans]
MVDIGELHEILQDASIEPPANDEGFHRDKNIQKLQTLYDQTPCMDDLQTAIVGVMADDRKGKIAPAIDRVLDVVSAVTYSTDDLLAIVEFGIRCSQVEDKQIRLRSTQLLALLLQNIPEIPDSIWDALVESMLIRVRDKIVSIRVQTIMVLKRLQQPDLPDDEVTAALLRLAVVDTSKEVRVAAVESVALTQVSVGDLLIRVRDISYEVRCSVFRVFSQAHVKDICTALDRMYLLDQGLHDRNPAVIEACQGMVLQWLHQCHDNVLDFLQYLALDHPVCSTVITFLFDKAGLSDLPQVKSKALLGSRLTPIDSFFWKEQCIHFKNDHDLVEEYCPTLPTYCDLLRHLQEELNEETAEKAQIVLVGRHLLQLGTALDFQDEVGRRMLINALRESLSEWTYERQWVPDAVSLLAVLCEEFEFIQYMTEITSDIYDAMQECESMSPTKRRAMSERLDAIDQRMDEADVPSQEYDALHAEGVALEKALEEPKTLRYLRCLELSSKLLQFTRQSLKNAMIANILHLILPAVDSDIPALREKGLECLGLYCLLDRKMALNHTIVFWRVLNADDEDGDSKHTCIRVLLDFFAAFKAFEITPVEEDGETVTSASILDGLATYFCVNEHQLDAWDLQTQTLVVEGFIKLFLLKRIDDSMKLQAMMELYFHPILRQMVHSNDHGFCSETLQLLSVFYPALANLQFDLLIVTIRSVLCSIVYGTSKIPLDEAALYFLTIFPEKDRAHDALSLLCCVEILAISELKLTKREKETLQKPWWIVLQSLEWTDTNGRLVVLLEEVLNSFKAADATKFKARMEQVIQAPPELTDEDTQWILAQVAERKDALSTFKKKLSRAVHRHELVVQEASDSEAGEEEQVMIKRERSSRQSKALASAKIQTGDSKEGSSEVEAISSSSESDF